MKYYEIEQKMESLEGMTELLNGLQENHFNCIDYHTGLFRTGQLTDQVRLQQTIDELTGVYMDLQTYASVALTMKINKENGYFHNAKIEATNAGAKVTASILEREASYSISNERRVLNILEGKINACEKAISTCQSRMKVLASEIQIR